MDKKRILVVDDEKKVCDLLRAYLERDGCEVVAALDGNAALIAAHEQKPDLILLDLNLPEVDGLDVCRNLRKDSDVPIVMLTARDDETDKIVGLEVGADDYVTKPFSPREVVARVNAVLRRPRDGQNRRGGVVVGKLELDASRHVATYDGEIIPLTATEFKLLLVMLREPGRVYSRLQLMDMAFGDSYDSYDRTIDAHIKNIRQKISRVTYKSLLVTVRGVGYKVTGN
jgi:two-component system alkaline phosphatase synthesis response regulator PhoP